MLKYNPEESAVTKDPFQFARSSELHSNILCLSQFVFMLILKFSAMKQIDLRPTLV